MSMPTSNPHWKLFKLLTLRSCCTVAVRTAPSLCFAHVDPKLMSLYLLLFRPEQAPSMLVPAMSLQELRDRMDEHCRLPPLVYPRGEYYYMQSPLWPAIMQDVDMTGPPFSCLEMPGASSCQTSAALPSDQDTCDPMEHSEHRRGSTRTTLTYALKRTLRPSKAAHASLGEVCFKIKRLLLMQKTAALRDWSRGRCRGCGCRPKAQSAPCTMTAMCPSSHRSVPGHACPNGPCGKLDPCLGQCFETVSLR